ncbi:MAG: diguanylate cyclase, partial [Methyloprofundus sp.]|nr:diguanylate cyclase [Methyloprofundus sp.]
MNMLKTWFSLFFLLAMLLLASSLYSLSQVDHQPHQNKVDLARSINEQAAQMSLAVFLVAQGGGHSYDYITSIKQNLAHLTQQLNLNTLQSTALYRSTLSLVEQVEQVKSTHAIYRNSLLFFPKASAQLHQRLNKENQINNLINQLSTLERKVLLFNISSDAVNHSELLQSIAAIENNPVIFDLPEATRQHFDLLLKHAQLIIDYHQRLKTLYASIFNLAVAERSYALLSLYRADFEASLNEAASIKQGFYLAILLLIFSVLFALSHLKSVLTKLRKNEHTLSLAATVFRHSPEGIVISDANNKILQVNAAFTQLTGYTTEDVIGQNPNILSSGTQSNEFYQTMWEDIHNLGKWTGELENRRKDGEIYPEHLTIVAVKNDQDLLTHHIAIFNDLSKQKQDEQHIHFLAHYDPLTQLANRRLFTKRLQQAILKSERSHKSIALLFIDLDRFKEINDNFGHKAGDQLLTQVASDIRSCTRNTDNAARIGGDEFVITLEELSPGELIISAPIVADKVLEVLSHKYTLGMAHAYIGASIGIAIYPSDALTADSLLQCADMAMYHAKEQGKNNFQFYSKQLNEKAKRRAYIEQELRQALSLNQFFLHYQPQYNIISKKIESFEALLRWRHPELGVVPPNDFISIAEESGLIIK